MIGKYVDHITKTESILSTVHIIQYTLKFKSEKIAFFPDVITKSRCNKRCSKS